MLSASNRAAAPDISIVLLTRNAGLTLAETLARIFKQRTRHSFEVLAIDSGSTDDTLEILRRFNARVHSIPPSEFNFGRTRELGYELACGDLLVTLSQDCIPVDEEWLERLTAPFTDPVVAAVAGAPRLPPAPARVFYWERIDRFYFTRGDRRWLARYHLGFSNTNSAVRKAVWERNRLGPIEMCEDRLLQKNWTAHGLEIRFAPDAAVYHAHDYDLGELVRRCENEGLGLRLVGEPYSFHDCVVDIFDLANWRTLFFSIIRGARPTRAELLFPLIRPLYLWKGHRWTQHYVR